MLKIINPLVAFALISFFEPTVYSSEYEKHEARVVIGTCEMIQDVYVDKKSSKNSSSVKHNPAVSVTVVMDGLEAYSTTAKPGYYKYVWLRFLETSEYTPEPQIIGKKILATVSLTELYTEENKAKIVKDDSKTYHLRYNFYGSKSNYEEFKLNKKTRAAEFVERDNRNGWGLFSKLANSKRTVKFQNCNLDLTLIDFDFSATESILGETAAENML